jgi:hypothetical protein
VTLAHSLFIDAVEWVRKSATVCVFVCGHKTLPLFSVLGQFNVIHTVLDPFCDCLIHAFVFEMAPSQEVFGTRIYIFIVA